MTSFVSMHALFELFGLFVHAVLPYSQRSPTSVST